jgi:hypothetical protein
MGAGSSKQQRASITAPGSGEIQPTAEALGWSWFTQYHCGVVHAPLVQHRTALVHHSRKCTQGEVGRAGGQGKLRWAGQDGYSLRDEWLTAVAGAQAGEQG